MFKIKKFCKKTSARTGFLHTSHGIIETPVFMPIGTYAAIKTLSTDEIKRMSFDLVLSNPPYIPSDLIEELEPIVKNHEPRIALDGGDDGMNPSRKIILGALNGLSKGGWLILEHHYDQSEKITSFMRNIGMEEVSFEKDLGGIKRYAICRRK